MDVRYPVQHQQLGPARGRDTHAIGPNWLGDPTLAILSIVAVNVWRGFPYGAVILLAGMSAVPGEVLEPPRSTAPAQRRRFRKVIVPMIAPVLFVGSLYDLAFTLTDMTVVYLLTRGGPANVTHVLSSYAFLVGVESGALGRGDTPDAAMKWAEGENKRIFEEHGVSNPQHGVGFSFAHRLDDARHGARPADRESNQLLTAG